MRASRELAGSIWYVFLLGGALELSRGAESSASRKGPYCSRTYCQSTYLCCRPSQVNTRNVDCSTPESEVVDLLTNAEAYFAV